MIKRLGLTFLLSTALALPAAAQGRNDRDKIPKGFRPPPGMCRIWLDNVPPGQQPAPTDCATAVRNRPPNGRVIFGDDYVEPKRLRPAERNRPDDDDRDDERRDEREDVRREDRRDDDDRKDGRREEAERGGSDDAKGRVDSARKRRRPNG